MMKFKIKIWNKESEENDFAIDECTANNEAELHALYGIMGQKIQVISKEGIPLPSKPIEHAGQPSMSVSPSLEEKPLPPASTQHLIQPANAIEMIFTSDGTEFKVVNNEVFKKDWVILNKEYQIFSEKGKKINNNKYIVKVKDWIKVK